MSAVGMTTSLPRGSAGTPAGATTLATMPTNPLVPRLRGLGTSIFAEMSALALETGSINLGQGFPDVDGPDVIKQAVVDAIWAGRNQYPPGPGVPELRRAIADHQRRFYGLDLDPDTQVLVTAGATEAIAAAMLALVDEGDEVIALEPYYDSYVASIVMARGVRVPVTLACARFPIGRRPVAVGGHTAHPIDSAQYAAQSDRAPC